MLIQKINNYQSKISYKNNSSSVNIYANHKFQKTKEDNRNISKQTVQMIGATILAGTVAFLLIGHHKGWFKPNKTNSLIDGSNQAIDSADVLLDI